MKNILYTNCLVAQYQSLWLVLAYEHCHFTFKKT